MLLLFLNVCTKREEWKQSLLLSTILTCTNSVFGVPEISSAVYTAIPPFTYYISAMIMGVLPLLGIVFSFFSFFFFGSAVFIGCGGEKMIGIPKMPSALLTCH